MLRIIYLVTMAGLCVSARSIGKIGGLQGKSMSNISETYSMNNGFEA